VDILPFIYSAAIGNPSWRSASNDIVYYLHGRESIEDFMFNATTATERRVALVPNSSGGIGLPYVLHTTDEYPTAPTFDGAGTQPSHAIGFRTVDKAYFNQASDNTLNVFGGGKLGMYTYWIPGSTYPNVVSTSATQFEFYDYYANEGYRETGNSAFDSGNWNAAGAGVYLNAYNNIMAGELYNHYAQVNAGYGTALATYLNYVNSTGTAPSAPNTIPAP
jgi:hypothetical protein